jgi:hypothetical protein
MAGASVAAWLGGMLADPPRLPAPPSLPRGLLAAEGEG